jgi:hypothetical protein
MLSCFVTDSPGRVISPTQRPLPDNTQHPHETNTHASGVIRICNPIKRAAAHPCLRSRGHWDRQTLSLLGGGGGEEQKKK